VLDDLHSKPGHLIRRSQQVAVETFNRECSAFNVTPVQYAALVVIATHPDIDATRLAASIAFDRSTIGSVIERLEAKKLITRAASKTDKRMKHMRVTTTGKKLLNAIGPAVEEAQERMLDPLSRTERKTLMSLLGKIVGDKRRAAQNKKATAEA